MGKIEEIREAKGKSRYNDYLVINTDEQYASDIIKIMEENGHWG